MNFPEATVGSILQEIPWWICRIPWVSLRNVLPKKSGFSMGNVLHFYFSLVDLQNTWVDTLLESNEKRSEYWEYFRGEIVVRRIGIMASSQNYRISTLSFWNPHAVINLGAIWLSMEF